MSVKNSTCLVWDSGQFVALAERLARDFGKVYYFCTDGNSCRKMTKALIGTGLDGVEVLQDSPFEVDPDSIDCYVFTDVVNGFEAEELRNQGRNVWGAGIGTQMEEDREGFKKEMEKVGLPVGPYQVIKGLDNLRLYLKEHKNVYVKISKFRGCFDEQTDILTDSGWKPFSGLDTKDQVATLDLSTRVMSFVPPTKRIAYWYEGPMVRIDSRNIDALVTPNHRFWTRSQSDYGAWKYKSVSDMEGRACALPAMCRWEGSEQGTYTITTKFQNPRNQERVLNMADWLEFLGWFVSEGCLTMSGGSYRVTVSQCVDINPDNHEAIYQCLKRMGFNPQREGKIGWSVFDKSLWLELKALCYAGGTCPVCGRESCSHTKAVPRFIYKLSPDQVSTFLRSYGLGDGSVYMTDGRHTPQQRYYTSSPSLASGLQDLLYRVGHPSIITSRVRKPSMIRGRLICSTAPQYTVSVHNTENIRVDMKRSATREDYRGMVYDVTVEPHHTILVRRNGKSYWSGNSFETFFCKDYWMVENELDQIKHEMGPLAKITEFIVEEALPNRAEIGVDFFTIDGKYPENYEIGIEAKDAGFVGRMVNNSEIPRPLAVVNKALAPIFKRYGYRGDVSTEVRTNGPDDIWLTDMTCRRPAPPGEATMELYTNISDIICEGSQGRVVEPIPLAPFCAQIVLRTHLTDESWQTVRFPDEIKKFVKLHWAVKIDGENEVTPNHGGFLGGVVGFGDTAEAACKQAMEHVGEVEGPGIYHDTDVLNKVMKMAEEAEKLGLKML
jgi:hypothetical protein